jgi:hypothetical protein
LKPATADDGTVDLTLLHYLECLNAGKAEPPIIHLACEFMTLRYLKQNAALLKPGENPLRYAVERQ